jgi:sirohydrochlorin cobaltochelatase
VPDLNFQDATLVLLGHGSTLNAESATPIYQHADELRKRGLFASVIEGFWKQEPGFAGVLRGAFTPRIFVVPIFISDGYFTEEVIPRELGLRTPEQREFQSVQRRGEQTLFYCRPIGTHSSMTKVLLARAADIIKRYPFPRAPKPADITLFIAGHGTGNNENSRTAIERQVELIRELKVYAGVHSIFMEEEPRIGECYALAQTRNIIVVPFFVSDGLHSFEDIPVMLGEPERVVKARLKTGQPTWRNPTEKKGKLVWYSQSIGNEPLIADVIMERAREAVSEAQENAGQGVSA